MKWIWVQQDLRWNLLVSVFLISFFRKTFRYVQRVCVRYVYHQVFWSSSSFILTEKSIRYSREKLQKYIFFTSLVDENYSNCKHPQAYCLILWESTRYTRKVFFLNQGCQLCWNRSYNWCCWENFMNLHIY